MDRVVAYGIGFVHTSVCAVADATPDEIRGAANRASPTGLDHGWEISEDKEFATGEPNPCPCNEHEGRQHWLLVC
jgi:hypothetical protein